MRDVQYYKELFDCYGGMMWTIQLAEEKVFYPQREKLITDGYVEKIRRGYYQWVNPDDFSEVGKLLARKHFYFVPFGQDDAVGKPTGLVRIFPGCPEPWRRRWKEESFSQYGCSIGRCPGERGNFTVFLRAIRIPARRVVRSRFRLLWVNIPYIFLARRSAWLRLFIINYNFEAKLTAWPQHIL